MGVELRDMGLNPDYAPIIKRAAHRLSDGRGVIVVPDTNLASEAGDDTTGVAKIYVYLSTDWTRTEWTQVIAYTPASAPAASTREFVGSSALRENNTLAVVYAAADNSLRLIVWTWGGSSWGAPSEETIIAANAVTRRFRAVDMDFAPSNENLAVIVYESLASTGQGMWIRLYVKNDSSTWVKMWEHNQFTTQFIKDGAPDIAMSWSAEGIVSNVGKIAIYYPWTSTTVDNGDYVRLISVDVTSAVTNSGTLVNSWFTTLNKSIASGSRRGWLYQEADGIWMFATSVGTTVPQFIAMRLREGVYTGITQNKTSVAIQSQHLARKFIIMRQFAPFSGFVSTDYVDGRLVFAIAGVGVGYNVQYSARMIMMRFDEFDLDNDSCLAIDTESRPLDQGYHENNGSPVGVIGIHGGGAKYNRAGIYEFNFAVLYGSYTSGVKVRAVTEDYYAAPSFVAPRTNPAMNFPLLRASFQDDQIFSNLKGKIQFQWSTSSDFSTDLKEITAPDSDFISYSSGNGVMLPVRSIQLASDTDVDNSIYPEVWFGRCRMKDDMGNSSDWSTPLASFTLSHPPTANPVKPINSQITQWVTGDIPFRWLFSDTEPTDIQTAYQVVITRTDTGAVVEDTGKVISGEKTATIDIDAALRGIPLQWTVSLWDTDDTQGPFSTPHIFTALSNPLVAILSPEPGTIPETITTATPTIQWLFQADNDRTQRAFRIVVINEDLDDATVADTGWIISDETTYTFSTNILQNSQTYQVYVEVQDSVGLYGASNAAVNAGNVDFESNILGWSATDCTIEHSSDFAVSGSYSMKVTPDGGATDSIVISDIFPVMHDQKYYASVWIYFPNAFAGDVSIFINMYDEDGDSLAGSGTSETALAPNVWHRLEIDNTMDSADFFASIEVQLDNTATASDIFYLDYAQCVSEEAIFTTDWVEPAQPACTVTYDEYKATVSWTDASIDADFIGYRVYRKYMVVDDADLDINDTNNTWVLIHETNENEASLSYNDYTVPLNKAVTYCVVQVVDRFGSLIESDITTSETVTVPGDRYYFVPLSGIGAIASYQARNVVADGFTYEVEQEAIHVIGRGKQVQIGDELGYSGSLTIHLRDYTSSRADREFFQYISANNDGNIYMKSPFGDVYLISIGSVSAQRIPGVGASGDMVDLTVPYQQVFGALPVTRQA